ncbi:MAG: sugar MFS transporter [Cytophagaceae bacterium]|nr:sugar MFS transporter [Cytophagaceae bacterium]MDW8455323.1 sugar MFS transporter [Cytophagaceae bacterium]
MAVAVKKAPEMIKTTSQKTKVPTSGYFVPMIIIASLFFIFGFVTWINGALIPFMKLVCELSESQAYLVATAVYISFVVMALPASTLLKEIGYKNGMSIGLLIMAGGALLFIPAASSRIYSTFLLGLFIQGTGITVLQTAANPYVTILGPIESAAKRISIMGICNKVAGMLGSAIFGVLLLSGLNEEMAKEKLSSNISNEEKEQLLNTLADSVVVPYIVMASLLIIFAFLIRFTPLPEIENNSNSQDESNQETTKKHIFQFPHLLLGVLTLFAYVGAEVIAGDTIINYGLALNIPKSEAKFFTSYTLGAMVFTYGLGVLLIPKYISQGMALRISAVLGVIFSIGILVTEGYNSVLFVAALGIANALVWPAVWPLAINGLGKFTKTGAALLIMGVSGGAIIPPLFGAIVDNKKELLMASGMPEAKALADAYHTHYWILIPCYLIILYYAVWGHKVGLAKK